MIENAKYAHTNIVARDWKLLADFYQDVFGAYPVPPERDFHGEAVDALTGVDGARARGIHLRLPGHGRKGPTLEIFEYNKPVGSGPIAINHFGFAHIAFVVPSVEEARDEVLANGGSCLGKLVTLALTSGARVNLIYMKDPEGNIVELQHWIDAWG